MFLSLSFSFLFFFFYNRKWWFDFHSYPQAADDRKMAALLQSITMEWKYEPITFILDSLNTRAINISLTQFIVASDRCLEHPC